MDNNILDRIKLMSLAQLFVQTYSYQEVIIKNVEGIFLQNKGAHFHMIRISNTKYSNTDDFNKDLVNIKRITDEYSKMSFI
ncbi:MAG: hypothetical protein LBR40_04405, partial [Bacilli bacterium]|nr:hypothetical protein [Bacilli bacterium]